MRLTLTADIHLRYDKPVCYADDVDWMEVQEKTIEFLGKLGNPVICAGDFFDKAKQPIWFLNKVAEWIIKYDVNITSVYGNHDLFGVGHNISRHHESSLALLNTAGIIHAPAEPTITNFYSIEVVLLPPEYPSYNYTPREGCISIAVLHEFVYAGSKPPYPGCPAEYHYSNLWKRFPGFDIILTGDSHTSFAEQIKNEPTIVINPGCLVWQKISECHRQPSVYIVDSESDVLDLVKFDYLNIDMLTRDHLEIQEEKERRLSAFVSKLNSDEEVSLSFVDNLEMYMKKNKVSKEIQKIVWDSLQTS